MNYTQKENNIIFELPLSNYLQNYQTLQDYEDDNYKNFNFDYLKKSDIYEYEEKEAEAIKYLKERKEKYTDEEMQYFADELQTNIEQACNYTFESNYLYEWNKKYYKLIQENINSDVANALNPMKYQIIDDITATEYWQTGADVNNIRIIIDVQEIKKWYNREYKFKEEQESDDNIINIFADNVFDFSASKIDTEYIDYYGTLGGYDDWMEYFRDNEDLSIAIDKYRKEEMAKINNADKAIVNLSSSFENIKNYTEKYLISEPKKSKIIRQIKALKSIIQK